MELKKAQKKDIELIMSMVEDVKNKMYKEKLFIWDDEYPTTLHFEEDIENETGQLVIDNDKLIGYVSLGEDFEEGREYFPNDKILFVSRLVIDANLHGQGIGTKLMHLIEKEAIEKDFDALGLLGDVSNKRANALFKKSGYRNLGTEMYPWGPANLFLKELKDKKSGLKMISWNVNGLRAVMKKGFDEFLKKHNPDILALQEIKMKEEQADFEYNDYNIYWNSAERPGYSGTCIFSKIKPIQVIRNLPYGDHPAEGRVLTLEFDDFYFVTVYAPNSQRDLLRIDYRMQFEDDFRKFLIDLKEKKEVIICGDFNVAHEEIDLKNPKQNIGNAGFSDEEREKMSQLLNCGYIDTFRHLYPTRIAYSWWSYLFKARERNIGWRLDYFITSEGLKSRLKNSFILMEVIGSDHCPVGIILNDKTTN